MEWKGHTMATIRFSGCKALVSGMLPDGTQFRKTYSKERYGVGYRKIAQAKYEELLFENSGLTNASNSRKVKNLRNMTVRELANRYITEHLSITKAQGNRSYVDVIISKWGGWRLHQITIGVVRPWIHDYLNGIVVQNNGKRYSAAYSKKLILYFQRLYNWGCETELIDRNPIEHIIDYSLKKSFSRRISPRRQIISNKQFEKIMSVSPLWFQRVCYHSWGTGMRQGEIAGLRWDAVHDGIIILTADQTKEADCKIVAMDPDVIDQVNAIRLEQEIEGKSEFVYLGESGSKLKAIQISDSWRTYRRKAGLLDTDIRFHDIRRTYIDRKRRGGATKWVLARQVGHHAAETTDRNYPTTARMDEIKSIANISNSYQLPPSGDN